jgi:hypothetical protein
VIGKSQVITIVELVENEVMAKSIVGIRNTTGDHLTHHLTSLGKKVLQQNFDHPNFNSIEDAIMKSIFTWYGCIMMAKACREKDAVLNAPIRLDKLSIHYL